MTIHYSWGTLPIKKTAAKIRVFQLYPTLNNVKKSVRRNLADALNHNLLRMIISTDR